MANASFKYLRHRSGSLGLMFAQGRGRVALMLWFGLLVAPWAMSDEAGVSTTAVRNRLQVRVVTDDDFLELSAPAWCKESLSRAITESKSIRNASEIACV